MNDTLSHAIQERIEADKIMPTPRGYFILLRSLSWVLACLSIIVGSIAVATTLFLFVDYHAHGLPLLPHELAEFLSMVPIFWIIVLGLFMLIARESIKHTKTGYRYRLRTILAGTIIASVFFGSLLNAFGVGRMTHTLLHQVPLYGSIAPDAHDAWNRPHMGRLGGTVISTTTTPGVYSVRDFSGHAWLVRIATSTHMLPPGASSTVRMYGAMGPPGGPDGFMAEEVHIWEQ